MIFISLIQQTDSQPHNITVYIITSFSQCLMKKLEVDLDSENESYKTIQGRVKLENMFGIDTHLTPKTLNKLNTLLYQIKPSLSVYTLQWNGCKNVLLFAKLFEPKAPYQAKYKTTINQSCRPESKCERISALECCIA